MSHRLAFAACLAFGLLLAPAPSVAEDEMDVVKGWEHCVTHIASWDRLNIRTAPDSDAEIVASYRYAECGLFVTADCVGQWCPVEDGDIKGWAHSRYLGTVSPILYCVRDAVTLPLRAYPSEASRLIIAIPSDSCEIATLPYWVSGWQKIRIEGHEGWIPQGSIFGQ